jgi:MFS family permease
MREYRSMIGLSAAALLMMLGVGLIVSLLPGRILALTGSPAQVGLLASSYAVACLLLQVPFGRMADRLGMKPLLVGGYLVCALAGWIYYFAASALPIFGGRVLQGAGEAPLLALAPALLSLKHPRLRGLAIGLYYAAIHVGLAGGPLLARPLARVWSAEGPYLFYALLSMAGGLIVWILVEDQDPAVRLEKKSPTFRDLLIPLSQRGLRPILSGIALHGAGYGVFLTTVPAALITEKGYGQTAISWFFVLFYGMMSVTQVVGGSWSDHWSRRGVLVTGFAAWAAGLFLFPSGSDIWVYVWLGLASVGLGLSFSTSLTFLGERTPEELRGSVSGTYYMLWGLGLFLGPILMGKLAAGWGFPLAFRLMAGLLAVNALGLVLAGRREALEQEA